MLVIEIAAGILLAVSILAFLPWVLIGTAGVFVIALLLTIIAGVVGGVLLIAGVDALALLVIGGVLLFVVFDVIKNRS